MKWIITFMVCGFFFSLFSKNYCVGKFELLNKMIVVEATVEDQLGYFVIDTGAPYLVLNKQYFKGEKSKNNLVGVTGAVKAEKLLIHSFQWGCIEEKNFTAFVVQMDRFEQIVGKPFFGLIGYEILKQKELLFDYRKRTIEQHKLNKSDLHRLSSPSQEMPFRLSVHMPIMKIQIGNKFLKFVLDTASEDNLLSKKNVSNDYKTKAVKFLTGTSQQVSLTRSVIVPDALLTNFLLEDQEYLVADLQDFPVEGILGFPILKTLNKFSINYRKKKIYLWE